MIYQGKSERIINEVEAGELKLEKNQKIWKNEGCSSDIVGHNCIKLEYNVSTEEYMLYVHVSQCIYDMENEDWNCVKRVVRTD